MKREWQKSLEIKMKHMRAMHVELGRFYDIPECCIDQFCDEEAVGIPSAMIRQNKHGKFINPMLGYVPCDKCMIKLSTGLA